MLALDAQVNIEIYWGKTLNHLLGFVRETRVDNVVHFQITPVHTYKNFLNMLQYALN